MLNPSFSPITSFNADQWSDSKLKLLKIIVIGCRCLSILFGFVAFIMLIATLAEAIESIIPFSFVATSSISILIMGEALQALCVIAENTKSASECLLDSQYKIANLQGNVENLQHNVESLEKNMDEMCTSLSEIADNLRESSIP